MGRMYVRYFNSSYGHTGTLWEGRYKSCLIESETYLLEVYRYIELNPVRASMIEDPSEYRWSSYQCNALGAKSALLTPHDLYRRLGQNDAERRLSYRALFERHVSTSLISDLRRCTNSGVALGGERFVREIETLSDARVSASRMGRPRTS